MTKKDEIKKAYRKLCKETHPDLATAANKIRNEELFKRISHAHSILVNDTTRHQYNAELDNSQIFHPRSETSDFYNHQGTRKRRGATLGIYRPRNLFIFGAALGLMAVVQSSTRDEKETIGSITKSGQKNFVEAWYNPQTKQYEQPAPWDLLYKQLKPEHKLVPRHLVQPRSKG